MAVRRGAAGWTAASAAAAEPGTVPAGAAAEPGAVPAGLVTLAAAGAVLTAAPEPIAAVGARNGWFIRPIGFAGALQHDRQLGAALLGGRVHLIGAHVGVRQRRREHAARPDPAHPDDVELRRVQGELRLQVEPGEQAQHHAEGAVSGVGLQLVADQVPAEVLQDLPADRGDHRAQQHVPHPDLPGGADPERQPEHADVQRQRNQQRADARARARDHVPGPAGVAGQGDRDDQARPDDQDQPDAAQYRQREPGAPRVGHRPDRVQRVLDGAGHPECAEQRQDNADDERDPGAAQRVRVAAQLAADQRVLRERRVQQIVLQLRVAAQHQIQHGVQDQQQREDRRECVIGHQRGQVAGLVVAELLPGADHVPEPGPPLLEPIDGVLRLLHRVHGAGPYPRPGRSSRGASPAR